jgi:hypothetical protein
MTAFLSGGIILNNHVISTPSPHRPGDMDLVGVETVTSLLVVAQDDTFTRLAEVQKGIRWNRGPGIPDNLGEAQFHYFHLGEEKKMKLVNWDLAWFKIYLNVTKRVNFERF